MKVSYRRPEGNSSGVATAIDAGTYEATCTGHYAKDKKFEGEPDRPGVVFTYAIDMGDRGAVELKRHITVAIGEKANLRKDMIAIHGAEAWDKALENDGLFTNLIDSTIDQKCLVVVGTKQGKVSRYSFIEAVMPLPKHQKAVSTTPGVARRKLEAPKGSYKYDLGSLIDEGHRAKAEALLEGNGATYDPNTGLWICGTHLESLKRYITNAQKSQTAAETFGDDDIPF